jgi:hypothetical protein
MVPFQAGDAGAASDGNLLEIAGGQTPLTGDAGASDESGNAEWRLPLLLAAVCAAALLLFIYVRRKKKEGQESESGESNA